MTETLQKREGLEIYRKMAQRDAHISIFSNESCEIDIYIYIYIYTAIYILSTPFTK